MFLFLFLIFVFLIFPWLFVVVSLAFFFGKVRWLEWSQRLGFYWFFPKNVGESMENVGQKKSLPRQNIAENTRQNHRRPTVIWMHLASLGEWKTAELFLQKCAALSQTKIFLTYFNADLPKYFQKNPPPHFIATHAFFPIENPLAIFFLLKRYNVLALCLLEVELWPITILTAKCFDIPIFWVNVSLFEKEKKAYRRFYFLFKHVFLAFHDIYAASQISRERILSLLPSQKKVKLFGHFKIDRALEHFSLNAQNTAKKNQDEWRHIIKILAKERKIIIFTSFHSLEKKAVQAFLAAQNIDCFIIFVPRYVDENNVKSWRNLWLRHQKKVVLRSELPQKKELLPRKKVDVLLLDSYGEMQLLFPMVDVAVVGGSFVRHGGQDILEPLIHGVATITGPYMFHFEQMMEIFSDFVVQASSHRDLPDYIHRLLTDENKSTQKKRSAAVREIMSMWANASENTAKDLVKQWRTLKKI